MRAMFADVVRVNIQMPTMGGVCLAAIRADQEIGDISIIAVTPLRCMVTTNPQLPQRRADEYLAKPLDLSDLLTLVERIVGDDLSTSAPGTGESSHEIATSTGPLPRQSLR
jgi:CheY-like chemotaxis protein